MIIDLRKRKERLLSEGMIQQDPMAGRESWEREISGRLAEGAFCAVLARAGMGKTAFLVQVALSQMLGEQDILHVSLHEPISKVTLWYQELFDKKFRQALPQNSRLLWENLLPHRFIMTFRVDRFSIPKLEERLEDFLVQDIFHPRTLFLDGWHPDRISNAELLELKAFARNHRLQVWLSVHVHRPDAGKGEIYPAFLKESDDLFEVILKMEESSEQISMLPLKDVTGSMKFWQMKMDPVTLLVTAGKPADFAERAASAIP